MIGLNGAALLMLAHGSVDRGAFSRCAASSGNKPGRSITSIWEDLGQISMPQTFLHLWTGDLSPRSGFRVRELRFGSFWFSSAPLKPAPGAGFRTNFKSLARFALWGVVISAVYMLRAYRANILRRTSSPLAMLSRICRLSSVGR